MVKIVAAINIATITDFGDGTIIKDCVAINSGESVYNVYKNLDKNRDDITVDFDGDKIPPYNPFIKGVNGYNGRSISLTKFEGWNFWVTNTNKNDFTEPPELAPGWGMGIGDYKITNSGEVIGLGYGVTEYNADWTIKTPPAKPAFVPYEDICEKLVIDEVTAYVDGDKSELDEGEKIKNVKPNSILKLKVKVKNYNEHIEIKNIAITAVIKEIDDGSDIKEKTDRFNLDSGDSKTATIEFEIPLEVEDDSYRLILEAEGIDNRGVSYKKTLGYSIDIKKEKHDVVIIKAELTNPILKCLRTTSLNVNVMNMGTSKEGVVLKVINNDLGLSKQASFELSNNLFDDDSKYNTIFTITVDKDQKAGVYPILIKAGYSGKSTEKTVELDVVDCTNLKANETKSQQKESIKNQELTTNDNLNLQKITTAAVKEIKENGANEAGNKSIILIIILIYIVIAVVGVILVVRLGKINKF